MKVIRFLIAAVLAAVFMVPVPAGAQRWQPNPADPWQIVLSQTFDVNNPDHMIGGGGTQPTTYDIDGFSTTAATVAALHARGYHAVCYIDVGAAESYRPDYASFPSIVKGKNVSGWPQEKWLDVRRIDILGPIMTKRFQMCKDKGFDAVDPDMIEAWQYGKRATGFAITYANQITYNRWIADTVHSLDMSVALKNDLDQLPDLEPWFDFAVNESCTAYNECGGYAPFVQHGKAVLHISYVEDVGSLSAFCPTVKAAGLNGLMKHYNLDGYRRPCI